MNVARTTGVVLALTAAGLLPMLLPDRFAPSSTSGALRSALGGCLSLGMPVAAIVFCWRRIGRRELLLLLLLALLLTYVHLIWVDTSTYPGGSTTNLEWQQYIHGAAVHLDPGGIPHSYRFLPDSVTRVLEALTGSYTYARNVYRFTFTLLLLLAIHEFARLYVSRAATMLVLLLYTSVYPVTIYFYAGQLSDPMSHLAFVAAFVALELGIFSYFFLAVAIGVLAKESIAAMLVFYLLFHRKSEPRFWWKLSALSAVSLGLLIGVRFWVIGRGFHYAHVSEVSLEHVVRNLSDYRRWFPQLLFAVGVFVPLTALGWSRAHPSLKRLTLFLLAVLFVSSALFSWLYEVRNFVPAILPMAVIAAGYLDEQAQLGTDDRA